jgi:hypothetical protein
MSGEEGSVQFRHSSSGIGFRPFDLDDETTRRGCLSFLLPITRICSESSLSRHPQSISTEEEQKRRRCVVSYFCRGAAPFISPTPSFLQAPIRSLKQGPNWINPSRIAHRASPIVHRSSHFIASSMHVTVARTGASTSMN